MKLALSAAAEARDFSRKFHRARKTLHSLVDEFSTVEMVNPIHDAILIGLTDSMPPSYFAEVKNKDGFFQVLAGVDGAEAQGRLTRSILSIIEKAVCVCPFSSPDRQMFLELLLRWRDANLAQSDD